MLESQLGSKLDEAVYSRFRERLHFFRGDLGDPTALTRLKVTLEREPAFHPNIVFYLALMPAQYGPVARSLAENGLIGETPPVSADRLFEREDQRWRNYLAGESDLM